MPDFPYMALPRSAWGLRLDGVLGALPFSVASLAMFAGDVVQIRAKHMIWYSSFPSSSKVDQSDRRFATHSQGLVSAASIAMG